MAGDVYLVDPAAGAQALCALQARDAKAPLALKPGRWTARVIAVGLAEETIAFSGDRVRIGLASGEPIAVDGKMAETAAGDETVDIARRLPKPSVAFDLAPGGGTRVSAAMVFDRGTKPEIIAEFKQQILGKVPDGSVPIIVASALAGAFADLGIALAVAGFTMAADALIESMFGRAVIIRGVLPVQAADDGAEVARICLTRLPDPAAINVGHRPGPRDYKVAPDGALYETARGQAIGRAESVDHPGHIPSVETHVVLELRRG